MTIAQVFSAEAETAAQRYRLLVEGWRSLYQRALNESDFGSARQLSRVIEQAYAMARTYLETEYGFIQDASQEIALEAHRATVEQISSVTPDELLDAISEHLIESEDYLKHEITVQVERDIAFLKQALHRTYLQVNLAARSQKLPVKAALVQFQIGNVAELHFFFHDRRNQKWPSQKFIRAVWRHHLLNLYNESVLLTLADHGIDKAEVYHANISSASHGMLISMSSGSALPTYSEIRNEVFHPNSDAILGLPSDVHS